jgi:hypothetical protein
VAQQQKLVTMRADLTPDRRLQGSQGRARKLYSALVSGTGIKGRPTQALSALVEGFISQVRTTAEAEGRPVLELLRERLQALAAHPGGPTFAKVVEAYWQAYEQGDEERREAALRWLQAEYANKPEAARDLGVREIIDDRTVFDHLKLMAVFTTMAGYKGLLVCLDELVNLYKLSHKGARVANYEQILNIINETQQGQAPHLGFLFGGTPDFLTDEDMEEFFSRTWPVDKNSNRTGIRLASHKFKWARKGGGISGGHPCIILDNSFPLGAMMNRNLTVQAGNCNHRRYVPGLLSRIAGGHADTARVRLDAADGHVRDAATVP